MKASDNADIDAEVAAEARHWRWRQGRSTLPMRFWSRGTWAQLLIGLVIFGGLVALTPRPLIATGDSPGGVITLAVLVVVAALLTMGLWRAIGAKARDVMRRLVVGLPFALLFLVGIRAGIRLEPQAWAQPQASADPDPRAAVGENDVRGKPEPDPGSLAGSGLPDQRASLRRSTSLRTPIGTDETVTISYSWATRGVEIAIPLDARWSPRQLAERIQRRLSENSIPLTASLSAAGRLELRPTGESATADRWDVVSTLNPTGLFPSVQPVVPPGSTPRGGN